MSSMREAMPQTAAFVDMLREAFGADAIDPSIRRGLAGEPTFYAEENGHVLGCRAMMDRPGAPVPPAAGEGGR